MRSFLPVELIIFLFVSLLLLFIICMFVKRRKQKEEYVYMDEMIFSKYGCNN